MQDIQLLQEFLARQRINSKTLIHLLSQGIEVEKLRLEIARITKGDCIDIHIGLIQAEGFLRILRLL